jgi:SAM-dependent methyltransferase
MGNGAFFGRKKKKVIPPPKDPLRKCQEIFNSFPAKERVISSLKLIPPGIPNRWDKILIMINRKEEATEENPDPLAIELDFNELKLVLKRLYEEVKFISSDGLALCRTHIPKMFDEHSVDRAQNLSKIERNNRYLMDQSLAYGEVEYDIFATMYMKIVSVYGARDAGVFYDLGSGVGQLVYTSAFIGNFEKVAGIETIRALIERAERRMQRWAAYKSNFTAKIQEMTIDFIEDDFISNSTWTKDGSFIFLHWTTFPPALKKKITQLLGQLQEGAHVITFTKPIDHELYVVLISDTCDTSWGKAEFFFHEKVARKM